MVRAQFAREIIFSNADNKICDTGCVFGILIERNYGESPVCERNYLLDLKYLGVANTELLQSVSFVTTLFILSRPGTKQMATKILGSFFQIGREPLPAAISQNV